MKNYKFLSAEPSIQLELFLPKKAKYQGTLYNTLVKGLELHEPIEDKGIKYKSGYELHFNSDKKNDIIKFLNDYEVLTNKYDEFVKRGENIFAGYSIYEVDGVFKGQDVYEERTNVIKVFFKPDYENLIKKNPHLSLRKIRKISKRFFNLPSFKISCYKKMYGKYLDKNEKKIVKYLVEWQHYIGFFFFGFILYELSISENNIEEEIWVTSIWGVRINRIKLDN